MIVIPGGVDQHTRFGMNSELSPGEDLEKFVQGSKAAGQGDKGVGLLSHQGFALVHGLDQNKLAEALVCNFDAGEGARDHSNDFASMIENGIGQRAHQADLRSAVHQAQACLSQ